MARPNDTTPRRSIKFLVMLAALAALMGVVATGCGTSDDDTKKDDKTEQSGDDADAEAGEKPAEDEDA